MCPYGSSLRHSKASAGTRDLQIYEVYGYENRQNNSLSLSFLPLFVTFNSHLNWKLYLTFILFFISVQIFNFFFIFLENVSVMFYLLIYFPHIFFALWRILCIFLFNSFYRHIFFLIFALNSLFMPEVHKLLFRPYFA